MSSRKFDLNLIGGSAVSELDRASQIRRSMAYVRHELDDEVDEIRESANTLADWHYYIKNYPWACLGAAAAIGYLVVPRKLVIERPDPETLEKLARKNHLVVDRKPEKKAKSGLIGTAFSFVGGLVLKTAMAQLGHQLASIVDSSQGNNRSAGQSASEASRSASSFQQASPNQPMEGS